MSSSIRSPLPLEMLNHYNNSGITAFRFRFRNIHAFTWTKAFFLDHPNHPLTPVILKRYALRQEIPLWWTCTAVRETGYADRVVRSWTARRTRQAFTESLKKRGFATDGRRLQPSGNTADLYGTAAISVIRGAAAISYVNLVKETDKAVAWMEVVNSREDKKDKQRRKQTQNEPKTLVRGVRSGREDQKQEEPRSLVRKIKLI